VTAVLETPATETTTPAPVYLRPENNLIFWTRWLLHIESQKIAALVLFLAAMALATAGTAACWATYQHIT